MPSAPTTAPEVYAREHPVMLVKHDLGRSGPPRRSRTGRAGVTWEPELPATPEAVAPKPEPEAAGGA